MGRGFQIEVRRVSAEAAPLEGLHKHVWARLYSLAVGALDRACSRTVFDHLRRAGSGGLGRRKLWSHTDTHLDFWFSDPAGGYVMSGEVSQHWAWLAFAAHRQLEQPLAPPGWEVVGPETHLETELVCGPAFPVVHLHHSLFAVVPRAPSAPLVRPEQQAGFDDYSRLEWGTLEDHKRDLVEWAALTGQCWCDLCRRYRALVTPPSQRYKPADHLAAARSTWDLLDSGAQSALEAVAATAVLAWPWRERSGPPELQVLSDWLRERGPALPMEVLAAMVASRGRQRVGPP